MTYQSPESLIRKILSEGHAPALKIPEPERVSAALKVLHDNGVPSAAKKDDKTITVSAAEANIAANVMDHAIQSGLIQARPIMVSDNSIDPPEATHEPVEVKSEPHPPSGGVGIGEATHFEDETEQNTGEIDADGKVKLYARSLNNRTQNQIKKIDESPEQLDELSIKKLSNYNSAAMKDATKRYGATAHLASAAKQTGSADLANAAEKQGKKYNNRVNGVVTAAAKISNSGKGIKVFAKEESEQLNELSYSKLSHYTSASFKQVGSGNALDKKIAKRKEGIKTAQSKKIAKVKMALESTAVETVLALRGQLRLVEARGERLVATHHSECGKHKSKIYKNSDLGEYRNEYHINGKYHAPADSFHYDKEDAHGTAQLEMKRMTKLNGALKEAEETGEDLSWIAEEFEQLDELSKATLGSYIKKASKSARDLGYSERDSEANGDHDSSSTYLKGEKRLKGISKATDKLVKEDQLDEISKLTLIKYVHKNNDSQEHLERKAAEVTPSAKDNNKMTNRKVGMATAIEKIHGRAKVNATTHTGKSGNVVKAPFGKKP